MHETLAIANIEKVRQRISEGDCPRTPALSVETLEELVMYLAGRSDLSAPSRAPGVVRRRSPLTYGQKLIAEAIEHHFGERDEFIEDDTTIHDAWEAFDALVEAPQPAHGAVEALREALERIRQRASVHADDTRDDLHRDMRHIAAMAQSALAQPASQEGWLPIAAWGTFHDDALLSITLNAAGAAACQKAGLDTRQLAAPSKGA